MGKRVIPPGVIGVLPSVRESHLIGITTTGTGRRLSVSGTRVPVVPPVPTTPDLPGLG